MRLSVLSAIVVLSGSTGTKTKCTISLICFNQALILMRLVFNWACVQRKHKNNFIFVILRNIKLQQPYNMILLWVVKPITYLLMLSIVAQHHTLAIVYL